MSKISQNTEEERRAAPRARALKKGTIAFKDRYCSAECMIRNESETGALLMVSQNQVIPNVFELKVYPERDFRIVEAIWRTPDAMGVRFADQVPTAPSAPVAAPRASVAAPRASVDAPNPHSTWDGIERRKQNRRQNDRRS